MINEISKERQSEILRKALDWFSDNYVFEDLLHILHEHLDMTDTEID